jgi:UDP-N-acetylglucosamine diphosphorylase/glucosamine-1-phosphate N-acetyltransferase
VAGAELVLYEDAIARAWHPFTTTRPAGELLYGAFTMRARAERIFGLPCSGHLTAPQLVGFDEPGSAPAIARDSIVNDRARLYLNSRAVLDWGTSLEPPPGPAVLRTQGEVVGHWAPAGTRPPTVEALTGESLPADTGTIDVRGHIVSSLWRLVGGNAAQIGHDVDAAAPPPRALPAGLSVIGDPERVRLGHDVWIEPGVVFDVTDGPIWLDDRVRVRAFTRLGGPAYIGRDSVLLGGPFTAVSIGPVCKVHGEVEETVVLGYTNKAHDGFIGHAYLGRWVNLGALTTNSDLKNNYGTIRLWTPAGDVDTGEMKIGCFLGDHVKTGIGVMLNTGTVIGAGSNVFGAAQPPKAVPPFAWGAGDALGVHDFERFLATAETAMARREVELTPGVRGVLHRAWRMTHGEVPA